MTIQTSALDVQELCDLIACFLTQSKSDLRACALVSSTFTSAAQRHLFSDIIFNRGCLDIDDLSHLEWCDETAACKRFCAVLESSPHLLVFIQRIRTSLEPGVLQLLSKFSFPNLHDIVFHRRIAGPTSEETVLQASKLIGSPSVRRVGLLSLIFNDVQEGLSRLFEQHTPTLDSIFLNNIVIENENTAAEGGNRAPTRSFLVPVKTLRWGGHGRLRPAVILDPSFPLDLSKLEDLDFGWDLSPIALKCIEWSRLSIRRFTLDAHNVTVDNYPTHLNQRTEFLVQFPALTHLTLISLAINLPDVEALLANLPSDNKLRYLHIQIRNVRKLKQNKLRAVGAVCANLHESCVVMVWVRYFASGGENSDVEGIVRAAFAEVHERGRLSVHV